MLNLLFAIITLDVFWNPNPANESIVKYELLISSSQTLSNPTVISVPPTPDPSDGKIHSVQTNWDTATTKYIAVRAVNSINLTSASTAALKVGEPGVPANLAATAK